MCWTIIFFVLAGVALLTQTARARSVTYVVRGPVKAAPAFFLAGVSWYLNGPPLLTLAFFLCACGDILLDMAKAAFGWAFEAGVIVFAAALICLSFRLSQQASPRPAVTALVVAQHRDRTVCLCFGPSKDQKLASHSCARVFGPPRRLKHHRLYIVCRLSFWAAHYGSSPTSRSPSAATFPAHLRMR